MYAGLYFVHVISLSIWLGALVALLLMMRVGTRGEAERVQLVAAALRGKVWMALQLAAGGVLVSGVGLIVKMGLIGQSKPLWLKLMEEGGGFIALAFVILVTLLGRKLRKAAENNDTDRLRKAMANLSVLSGSFIFAICAVVLVVSMRLAI